MKFRAKARYPRRLLGGLLGLALNVEYGFIPSTYEAHVRGSEIRPVVDLTWRRLYLSVNPILSVDLAGDAAGHPQFEPAATATVRVVGNLSLGVEYYGAFGPPPSSPTGSSACSTSTTRRARWASSSTWASGTVSPAPSAGSRR